MNDVPRDDIEATLRQMREDELIDFIRETVDQLNALGDRLEAYVERQQKSGGT